MEIGGWCQLGGGGTWRGERWGGRGEGLGLNNKTTCLVDGWVGGWLGNGRGTWAKIEISGWCQLGGWGWDLRGGSGGGGEGGLGLNNKTTCLVDRWGRLGNGRVTWAKMEIGLSSQLCVCACVCVCVCLEGGGGANRSVGGQIKIFDWDEYALCVGGLGGGRWECSGGWVRE